MKKILSLLLFTFLFANPNYSININPPTSQMQILQNIAKLKNYIYNLNILNETLIKLYNDKKFKFTSSNVEMNLKLKNLYNNYTYEIIEDTLKILNGYDSYIEFNNPQTGYIAYINYIYNTKYKLIDNQITNKLTFINIKGYQTDIYKNLKILKHSKNVSPVLENIQRDLISMYETIVNQTKELHRLNIIPVFSNYIDDRYHLPKKYAQTDGNTTPTDIFNFFVNGDNVVINSKSIHLNGLKDYYNIYLHSPKIEIIE